MKKTVLITGGSRGIGRAAAVLFARDGYDVIITYSKDADGAAATAKETGATAICADVADSNAVTQLFDTIKEKYGRLDVVINNAGISQQKLFTDITEKEWDRMFDVNIKGMFNICKQAVPMMVSEKQGRIINVSSIWGMVGASCEVHYSASKAAVEGFTKALAKELGPSGITVNCIAPGVIETDMNKNLSIAGVLPFVVSSYLINDPDLLFVNMELAADYPALPDIYSLVDDHTWTWDALKEMSRIVKKDLDGGTTWDITDQYGFAINLEDTTIPMRSLPYSVGERVYDRDAEGNIVLRAYTDKKHDFVIKILDLFEYDGGIILSDGNYSVYDSKYFGMGTSLIYQSSAGTASVFREVEFEFGIVPMPKYDEAQERYMQIDWGGLMCIPRLHPDAEFVGDVVEWLSYYGYKSVYPEFYNTLLCEKVGRGQEDSKKALDTIFSNLVYDAAMNYTSQNYYTWFDHFTDKKDANVKSWMDARTQSELIYIENLTNLFIALGAAQ